LGFLWSWAHNFDKMRASVKKDNHKLYRGFSWYFNQNPKDELSKENDESCYGRVAPSQCIRWKAKAKAEIDN